MADITMPQLGETVTEGTITKWFKQVGDQVAEDEVLFEVSTDKVDSEVPSPAAGYVTEIKVPEGETVDVGAVLAVIAPMPPRDGDGRAARRGAGRAGPRRRTGARAGAEADPPEPARGPEPKPRPNRHRHPQRLLPPSARRRRSAGTDG